MHPGSRVQRQRGFVLVVVLVLVAVMALGLSAVGESMQNTVRREREQDLLRVGLLYALALSAYRASSPGSQPMLPTELSQLLADPRFVGTVRHLRELYPDPLPPNRPWGLLRDSSGQILGIYSQSDESPFRREALVTGVGVLPRAQRYSEWKFLAKEVR